MATLRDIARRAGVSIGTVDRIIHNRGRFSRETAERVHRIVAELDYRPNQIARHLSTAAHYRVGVLLPEPEQDSRYWSLPLAGIRAAERELYDFGLRCDVVHFDRYRPGSFASAAVQLLENELNALALTPLVTPEAREVLQAETGDRPVVFFDTDVPGTRRVGFIGQESTQSGRLAARLLGLMMQGRGRPLVVAPRVNNHHLDSRITGFAQASGAKPEIVHVSVESDGRTGPLFAQLERSLTPDVSGIFVADASVHYVAEFLTGRSGPRPALVGYDLVPDNRRWLADGAIDFLLTQRPVEQGYKAITRLFRSGVLSEPIPDTEYVPIDILTPENLPFYPHEEEM